MIVPGDRGQRADLTEARDRAQHDRRVHRRERGEADTEPVGDAGTVVLHHHLGLGDQSEEPPDVAGLFQIEHHAALVAVVVGEPVREWPHPITTGRLHFHDRRAEIGEQLGRGVTGLPERQIDDA